MPKEEVIYKSIWYHQLNTTTSIGIVIRINKRKGYIRLKDCKAWIGNVIAGGNEMADEVDVSLNGAKFPILIACELIGYDLFEEWKQSASKT